MEPEIARRCARCGAAVRGRAQFCPQCGVGMNAAPGRKETASLAGDEARGTSGRLVDEAERIAQELNGRVAVPAGAAARASGDNMQLSAPPVVIATDASGTAALAETQRGPGMRVRAGERAERLRAASFDMLDDAQDDPALRFVLIALALFVLFLLILLFSHILA